MEINMIKAVKFVVGAAVGLGTARIVGSIVRNNVSPANSFQKVTVVVASFVIASLVADAATKYVHNQIDELVDGYNKTKQEIINNVA
jgi:hypothetical protein